MKKIAGCWLVLSWALLISSATFADNRTPIIFWHAMAGSLGIEVQTLANRFNESQKDYRVIPVYKGSYAETLTSTVAAFRVGQHPDLVQILEVGTATMMYPQGAIVPLYKIMQDAAIEFKPNLFIPAIRVYYSDEHKNLLAMPFNSSAAVLYYNRDAFLAAGLDPNRPPQTWPEMYDVSKQLLKSGYSCGFTTTWPSWIQVESFSAWHDLPIATAENGFKGLSARLQYENEPLLLMHIDTLARWQHEHVFQYGGRGDDAQALFTSGQCPMMFQSSGGLANLTEMTPFKLGVGQLPRWPGRKIRNTLIGGGALWVMSGKSKNVYHGAAKFIKFLTRPDIQVEWQRATGYLPITVEAYNLAQKQDYYKKYPGAEVAIKELFLHDVGINSRGLRLGNYTKIRELNTEALEAVWSGQMTARQAFAWTQVNANHVLINFEKNMI